MDYKELFKKYHSLLIENNNLKDEIKSLRAQLGIIESRADCDVVFNQEALVESVNQNILEDEIVDETSHTEISNKSNSLDKIKLFMSLFRGREDVYAKRWENDKKGTAGYSPVCANEWRPGICQKTKIKCSDCKHKNYLALNEQVVDDHLRGRSNLVAGIYPMCLDETCHFLAIDFDDEEWQKDITTLRSVCSEFKVSVAVERSRSGRGAHAWFFFDTPIAASQARKRNIATVCR